jgi:hypothetical protein
VNALSALPPAERDSELASTWECSFSLICVVLLTYGICLSCTFAHYDDYTVLWEMLSNNTVLPRQLIADGRVVGSLIQGLGFLPAKSIEQLWIPRLVSLCGISLLLSGLFRTLLRLEYSRRFAFTFAALTAFLPSFVVCAAWAAICFTSFASVASVGAFWIAESAWRLNGGIQRLIRLLIAIGLIVVAAHTYQPNAMFYLLGVLFLLLTPKTLSREDWLRLGYHLAILIVSLVLAFLLYRAYATSDRGRLDLDIGEKASWFLREPLSGSFCLMFFPKELGFSPAAGRIALAFFAATLAVGNYLRLEDRPTTRFMRMAAACALLPLLYAPNLIVQERNAGYRSRGALATAVLLLVCCGVSGLLKRVQRGKQVRRVPARWALVLTLMFGFAVAESHVINYFVVPCQFEWRFVRQDMTRLAVRQQGPLREVVFLLPNLELPIPKSWEYDEFGHLSISRPWVPQGICGLALAEVAPKWLAPFRKAKFSTVAGNEPRPSPAQDRWIVDVRAINLLSDVFYETIKNARKAGSELKEFDVDRQTFGPSSTLDKQPQPPNADASKR